jgi:SAM-dependent methyltransferase
MQPDEEIINRWKNSAQFWEKHYEVIRQMFAPVAQALIVGAQIGRGQTVLDVASGSGEPALTVASFVGPEGKVFGVDPIPEMVESSRRAAGRFGLKNAKFEIAFADQLPFPAETFDAAVSRFGIMFFPSPVDGVREMLRVLKPGRKLAVAVWSLAERNPFSYTLSRAIDRYVPPPPLDPDAPDMFRFAGPGKLLDIFSQAGAVAPTEHILHFNIQAPISVEEFWTLRCDLSEILREKIAKLSDEQKTEVKHLALEAFRDYSTAQGMSFPAEVLIVSGAKSPAA